VKHRILVAEDDDAMRTVLVEVLRDHGFEVLEASDGRELFWSVEQASRDRPVDLVVADIHMPVYNALEVAEAWQVTNGPRIVLITAFADKDVIARSEKLGVTVLGKPFEIERLLGVVRGLLEREAA
jgi:DNA-binding response OmpR family regulator